MSHCTDIQPYLSALIDSRDGDLDAAIEANVRQHLESCASCRAVLQDLQRIRAAARGLGPMAPPPHVWLQVAGQIRLRGGIPSESPATGGRSASVVPWLGLAAALVLITLGVYLVSRQSPPEPAQLAGSNVPAGNPVEAVAEELNKAAVHYGNAMAELEKLAQSGDGTFDPKIAGVLREQLEIADRAIAESRRAMESDPASQPARDSLLAAFRRKVDVLQATVALMNEMRQGNVDNVAASPLNKKGA